MEGTIDALDGYGYTFHDPAEVRVGIVPWPAGRPAGGGPWTLAPATRAARSRACFRWCPANGSWTVRAVCMPG